MSRANVLFDNKDITNRVKDKLKVIKELDLEEGLSCIENLESDLYTVLPQEEESTLMLKVDKKKNISYIIELIKETLEDFLNVGQDIVEMAYDINTYNNVVYLKRKY